MEQLHHEITFDEAQFQRFMNSIANGDPSSSSSTPYVYYDDLNNLPQTTMGADAYQMYDTPEDHHSYPAPSASLSPSMPPSVPNGAYSYSSQPISLSSSMPPSNYLEETYVVDQSTSEALVQATMEQLGPMPDIAPADNAHHYDGDGDFFGRGKDDFVGGFTAKREE